MPSGRRGIWDLGNWGTDYWSLRQSMEPFRAVGGPRHLNGCAFPSTPKVLKDSWVHALNRKSSKLIHRSRRHTVFRLQALRTMPSVLTPSPDQIVLNGFGQSQGPLTNGPPVTAQQSHPHEAKDDVIDTEFLIVGAGPAGAALACFLGSYGWPPNPCSPRAAG